MCPDSWSLPSWIHCYLSFPIQICRVIFKVSNMHHLGMLGRLSYRKCSNFVDSPTILIEPQRLSSTMHIDYLPESQRCAMPLCKKSPMNFSGRISCKMGGMPRRCSTLYIAHF